MSATLSTLEKYWFDRLGCEPSDLRAGKVSVFAHGTDEAPRNIVVFKKDGGCIISAPESTVTLLSPAFSYRNCDDVFDVAVLQEFFEGEAEAILGPVWLGGVDEKRFRPCHDAGSREIVAEDTAFTQACDPADIRNSGLDWTRAPVIGAFENDVLASVANYQVRAGIIAHIGIVTRPDYRGKGYAQKAVSHIAALALDRGLGLQYQTLMANEAAIALCRQLGFDEFAQTITIKI